MNLIEFSYYLVIILYYFNIYSMTKYNFFLYILLAIII